MNSEWPILTLGDVCTKITDGAHNSPKSVDTGKPMASVKDLTNFGVDLSQARLISNEEFDKLVKQGCQPEVGDVLIAKDGNSALDTVCSVNAPLDAVLLSSVAILRPDREKLDSDFLKYYFSSKQIIEYLKNNFISGAAIPRVVLKDFKRAEIKVPPLKIQKEISKKLRSLDNKIQLNRQTNQTLEQIAQAIFKSWFVDFEPTRAKIIAKEQGANLATQELAAQAIICGAITLEQLAEVEQNLETTLQQAIDEKLNQHNQANPTALNAQQLKTTATLFPNKLVESELGEIPEGWNIASVGDHVRVIKGRSYKSAELKESSTALVTLKSFMRGGGYREDGLKEYIGIYKPEQVVAPGELVMSLTDVTQAAEIVGKPAIVTRNNAYETLVASLDVAILRPIEPGKKEFFYGLMSTYRFHRYAESFATGTTVLHLKPKGITSFEFVQPNNELCKIYSEIVRPMLAKHEGNIHISRSLESLRNVLLPKLLSGVIDLKDTSSAAKVLI